MLYIQPWQVKKNTTLYLSHKAIGCACSGTKQFVVPEQALLVEMARIRLHGFSEKEVQKACTSMMSDVESAYIERDQDYSQVSHTLLLALH